MLKLFQSRLEVLDWREQLKSSDLGLVPTMGNLHRGHLSLIRKALEMHREVAVTIFVNPKQFGPNEDFKEYPRTLEADLEKIQTLLNEFKDRNLTVFAPYKTDDIFSHGFSTTISVGEMTQILCGKSRPGHFDGVTTVVYMLFKLLRPTHAYFGQKDYQQFLIIRKMTDDLEMGIYLKALPIVRETSGLALSSRNQYLKEDQKEKALILSQVIDRLTKKFDQKTFMDKKKNVLKEEGWEYLEALDAENLGPINPKTKSIVVLGALKVGTTRLIDNKVVTINA